MNHSAHVTPPPPNPIQHSQITNTGEPCQPPPIPDSPPTNPCAQPTAAARSLGKATKLFNAQVFLYKHVVYKHLQAHAWWFFKHMLSIKHYFECFEF